MILIDAILLPFGLSGGLELRKVAVRMNPPRRLALKTLRS